MMIEAAELAAILSSVRAEVEPFGWRVGVRGLDDSSGCQIDFYHDLSATIAHHIGPDQTHVQVRDSVQDALKAHRDFDLMRGLPRERLQHVVLMREIRTAITTFGWSASVVSQLLHPLIETGTLLMAEAEWLMEAGPIVELARGSWKSVPLVGQSNTASFDVAVEDSGN